MIVKRFRRGLRCENGHYQLVKHLEFLRQRISWTCRLQSIEYIGSHCPDALVPIRVVARANFIEEQHAHCLCTPSWLHARRIAGRDRNYRGPDLNAAANAEQGARKRGEDAVPLEPAPVWAGRSDVHEPIEGMACAGLAGNPRPVERRLNQPLVGQRVVASMPERADRRSKRPGCPKLGCPSSVRA